ncbi:copper amine oxidase N-terminal domain-containing protein [Paenibacillus sp. J22TS3]|uniref:copper amine oxidase N-terminal domain-containing protein n=1 Tax=Paenibacillus sp. J22TS3 TaxID=2807192 RepID=UPI001BCF7235|nr:copper amine oxidase N-terminal domain-containing protein [Paenibacillus sp. J22TS3]
MKILQKTGAVSLILALLLGMSGLSLTAYAGKSLELQITVGSKNAQINGSAQSIVQPYQIHGVTMVPLGVFKKAFGADIKMRDGNEVTLQQNGHKVTLAVGSPTIWIDGRKYRSEAAPAMLQNTLMAPLRLIANGIGAKVTTSGKGQITVSLQDGEQADSGDEGNINTDSGKTRIGSSYYGWSLDYPQDLILGSSTDESVTTFSDSGDTYYVEVHAGDLLAKEADTDTLMDVLLTSSRNSGETVLDQSTFPAAPVPYARIISSDKDGSLWEGRAYYGNKRIYTLYLLSQTAKSYKDLKDYDAFLDSFRPGFDPSDTTIKDVSNVKNGMVEAVNEEYGISLLIPAGWSADSSQMTYTGKNGESLAVYISSAPKGLTLESWADQLTGQDKQKFIPEAYQFKSKSSTEAAGEKGLLQEAEYNYGDGWRQLKRALLINGGYRYLLEYTAPIPQESGQDTFKSILSSLDIDFEGNTNYFGNLENRRFQSDLAKSVMKASGSYHYSVSIPLYWRSISERYEQSGAEYQFTGGSFKIETEPASDPDLRVSQLRSYYNEAAQSNKDFVLEGVDKVTFAGVPATVFRIHQTEGGVPKSKQLILFSRDGTAYRITSVINDSNRTTEQKAALQKTVESFGWTK